MKRFALFLLGALTFSVTAALAVDVDKDFSSLDKDSDSYISASEAKDSELLGKHWYKFDSNSDGLLDESEFSAFESADIDDLEPWILRHDWYGGDVLPN